MIFNAIDRKCQAVSRQLSRLCEKYFCSLEQEPVFILGNQKSGTTAVAALIAEASDQSVAIDLRNEFSRPTFQFVHQGHITLDEHININKIEFTRKIIKEPNLTLMYAELKQIYPDARFVFVVRDPRTNIRSILNRLGLPGNAMHLDKKQLSSMSEAWKLVMSTYWMGHEGSNYIESLSYRWCKLADVYLGNPDDFMLIRYEDFLKDKEFVIKSVVMSLGFEVKNDIRKKLNIQYQPRGNHRVGIEKFFSSANLSIIDELCSSRMRLLGYGGAIKRRDNEY